MKQYNNKKLFAIGIISFERGLLTERCVESIQTVSTHPYHIFLVDNGSKDRYTQNILNKFETYNNLTLIRLEKNYGPSYARNVILKIVQNEYLFFCMMDNDIIALVGWDEAFLNAMEMGADLIQPKLLNLDEETIERGPNKPRKENISAHPEFIGIGTLRNDPLVNHEESAHIVGTAAIIRFEVFNKIGSYDTSLHIGEDYDLSFRARKAGFKLRYVPKCELVHDHQYDYEYDLQRQDIYKLLCSHVNMWRKHQKVLYSPYYLQWFKWMYLHGEPMYMPEKVKLSSLYRRIRRRIIRKRCMNKFPNVWPSIGAARLETEKLAQILGL